jgi:hypothetical protein
MGKLSEISAEMDEQNIPEDKRNSLIDRVSAGMHAAEKKIDTVTASKPVKKEVKLNIDPIKPTNASKKPKTNEDQDIIAMDLLAKKIRNFADKTHNVVTLDGKNYVKVGVYQYLANLLHITPYFDFADESSQNEVWCICTIKNKAGNEITRTTMYADKDEEFLKDKPAYAVLGMAQTRAFVRAMKNIYGYLMEYAGYQSVAIEEIEKKGK